MHLNRILRYISTNVAKPVAALVSFLMANQAIGPTDRMACVQYQNAALRVLPGLP